jgi:hypothetical protein
MILIIELVVEKKASVAFASRTYANDVRNTPVVNKIIIN